MKIDKKSRTDLRKYFEPNARPKASEFADLIDAMLNQNEDGLAKTANDPLSIAAAGDERKAINFYEAFDGKAAAWSISLNPKNDAGTAKAGFAINSVGQINPDGKNRLFIDAATGYVGIGTIEPKSALDVNGDGSIEQTIFLGRTTTRDPHWPLAIRGRYPYSNLLMLEDSSGAPRYQIKLGDPTVLDGKSAGFDIQAHGIGSQLFIQAGTGNVGIGTNDPKAKLDVQQITRSGTHPTNGVLYVTGDLKAAEGIEFRKSDGTAGIGFGFNTIYAAGSDAKQQDLNLAARGTGQVSVTGKLTAQNGAEVKGRLTVEGDVGIGTTDPKEKLQIGNFGAGDTYLKLTAEGGNSYRTGIKLETWKSQNGYSIEYDERNNPTAGLAFIRNLPDSSLPDSSRTDLFLKVVTGDVGIGTRDPKAKLDVAGRVKVGGDLELGNSALYFTDTEHGNTAIADKWGWAAIENSKDDHALRILGRKIKVVTDTLKLVSLRKESFYSESGERPVNSAYDRTTEEFRAVVLRDKVGIAKLPTATLDVAGNAVIEKDVEVKGSVSIIKDLCVYGHIWYRYYDQGNYSQLTHPAQWKWLSTNGGNYAGAFNESKEAPFPSDIRLKTDLHLIPSALAKVSQLRGLTFRWNEQGLQHLTRDIESTLSAGPGASDEENRKLWQAEREKRYQELSTPRVGVLAQEVEAVLPEAVTTGADGYKSVSYCELIPLVIEALKEEDKISQEQARTIARQQTEIERLIAAGHAAQQQLRELQGLTEREGVERRLGRLEAAMNGFLASEGNTLNGQLSK
jgi:Chaperone of endosialidase